MNQLLKRLRLFFLASWRGLSIRLKLLLPVVTALVVVALLMAGTLRTPVDRLVTTSGQAALYTEITRLNDRVASLLQSSTRSLRELAVSYEVQDYALWSNFGSATALRPARSALELRLTATLRTGIAARFTDLRYLSAAGKQAVVIQAADAGGEPTSVPEDKLVSEGSAPYFTRMLLLGQSEVYVGVPEVPQFGRSDQSEPEILMQVGAPVYYNGQAAGVVVGSLNLRSLLRPAFQPDPNNPYEFQAALLDQTGKLIALSEPGPRGGVSFVGDLTLPALTFPPQLSGSDNLDQIEAGGRVYSTRLFANLSAEGVQNSAFKLVVSKSTADPVAVQANNLAGQAATTLTIIIALLLVAIALAGQALTRPFVQASQFATRLARQDFAAEPLPAVGGDEIARLARALNSMKDSLAKQVSVLEAGIVERTRNLEIAAEISRDAAQLHNIDELLKHTVDAIRQRFNFYHAQIFLLDDTREYAVLVTSTGEAGKELLARKHKLAVGSESVVGQATARGRTIISLDTQDTGVPHRYNPLLPLTRSEMALPLRTSDKIIGALDIQSVERDAFDQEDVQIFQVLADQIAIAIDNARLIEDSARRVSQIDDLNRQLTRTSWSEYIEERTSRTLSYEYDLLNLKATETVQPEERPTTNVETDIVVRGQTVGSLSVQESAEAPLTDEDRAVIQAVAERVALAVENARLVEQTQSALSRVEQLYQASRAFGSAVETREVYAIIAEQLSSFEFMDRITVMLARPDPNPDPPYFEYVFVWERTPVEANPFRVSARLSRIAAPFARLFPNPRLPRVADLDQDLAGYEATQDMFRSLGVQSLLLAPLATPSRWFGALLCMSKRPRIFRMSFVQYVGALADQIAVAIENRYLFEESQAEARRNRALAEAARISSQIGVDFATGVTNLIESVAKSANYDRWWYGQVIASGAIVGLSRVAASFPVGSPLRDLEQIALSTTQNTIAEAARRGDGLLVNDPASQPGFTSARPEEAPALGKHIAVPVKVGANLVGAFMVGRAASESDLDDRDMQLVTALASQIAVAQENRRLFNTAESGRQTLQSVLNSLPTGVLVIDAQSGATVLSNDLVQRLLGLDAFLPYPRIHTGTGVPYEDEDFPPRRILATGETVLAEDMSVLDAEGNKIDLLVNAAPVHDASGKVISAVAVFQDVTELRELENVLQESLRETTTLYESSRAIAAEYELGNILAVVSTQIDTLVAPDHLYIILSDAQKKVIQTYRAETKSGESVALLVEGESPVPRTILVADEAFVDSDITQSPELARDTQLKALNIQSVGTFPLNARSRTIGWVVIGFSTGRGFSPEERRFLATIADQAAVAIESARLAQQTAQALSETTLLYEASYTINRADSIEAAIEVMRDQARHFAPSQIDIFLVNNKREPSTIDWVVRWEAGQGKPAPVDLSEAPAIDDWQFIEAAPFFVENVAMTSSPYIGIMSRMHNWGQFVAQASVPLSVKGRSTGRLVVSFNRTYHFGRLEQQFLTALADQAAIVIDNFALVQQTQDSLEETATLYQSSRAIADAPDLQTVLQSTIDYAVQPVVSRAMLIRLLSDSWTAPDVSIEIAADWTRTDEDLNVAGIRFTPSQFPIWPQLSAQEILWIEDMAEAFEVSDDSRSLYETLNVRSLIVFPLSVGGKAIGALLMGSTEIWRRSEREIRIYSSLADQAAISMESRNLLEQAERRARQLQTSAQVSRAATSILDLDQLFDRTVNLIRDSFGYDHVQIFLVTPDNTDAQLVASTGEPGRQLLSIHHHLPVGSASVIGQVTSLGKPQIVSDTTDRRFVHRPNPYLPRTRAEMALPLIARNRIMGALDVQSNEPGAFTQEDVNVLSTLADQIAIAIDNAQLFELSTQRVDEMRFLFDATRAATTIATIGEESEEAFKGITRLILEKLRATSATLALMDSTGTALLPYTVQAPGIVMSTPSHLPIDDTFVKGLAAARQPVLFNDLAGNVEPEIAQIRDTMKNIGSIVMMPLLSGEVLVGMLAVAKRERNGFNQDALRLLETLGPTLSAIIQNARLIDEVQTANARLREVDRLKSQFLANMSHELRTPLNSIIGFSRVILKGIDGALTPMQEQDLTTIHESGKHLLGLVNDILDQAKIEAGKMELSYGYFSMVELIKGVMSTAVGLVKDKPVRLHTEVEPDLPQVWGDEFRSRQVLLNLVSNAAKFTTQGGVTVSAFHMEENGHKLVQVSVTDTGIGIPKDKLVGIFEAFQQVESSSARQYEGTGLGLPIAKSLVEMQGGRIWVDSEPGVGSTFSFTVPIQPLEPLEEQPEGVPIDSRLENQVAEVIEQAEEPSQNQRIILVIDDEVSTVNLYRRYLAKSGFEVIGGRAEETEDLAVNYGPRVILLDVNMPNRSGWDVLAHLKDRDETFEIPVIVCTVEDDRERAFRLGAAEYLHKPFEQQTLVDAVKRVELERDRRKILIIDDQPESIRLIHDALVADERFVVYEAVGGAQGLDMINSHWPDLVILDLRMPEMDGFAVLDKLHADPDTGHIPVLVITADDITDEERGRLNGVHLYHKQSISAEELLKHIVGQITW